MRKISNSSIGKTDKSPKPRKNAASKKATTKKAGSKKAAATSESGVTRRAILELLKREGEQTATALGDALDVTPMAARLHLYDLEAEGLVAARSEAKGRGRPQKLWALTDDAARIFPDAHQSLAVEMIKSVEELFGAKGLEKVITQHGNLQRATYRDHLSAAKTVGDKVKRLAALRADEGYMATAKKDGRDWLLIENHCPICSAAKACTRLCANELQVFADVLGKDVTITREEHILTGARRCAYRVSAK